MTVIVRYKAQLRQAAGVASESVDLAEPATVGKLLIHLAERHSGLFGNLLLDPAGRVRPSVLLFVGDQQIGPERAGLRDGDELTVLTPMSGG